MSGSNVYFSKAGFNSQTFTASGTFTVPEGVNNVLAYVVGGGGGGCGGVIGNGQGGGGGAGGEITFSSLTVVPNASVNVVVGSGGAGGVNGTSGSAGNDSYVRYNSKHVYAYAGLPGIATALGTQNPGGVKQDLAIYQAPGGNGGDDGPILEPSDGAFNQLGYFQGGQAGGGSFQTGGGGGGSAHGQGGEGGTSGGTSDGFDAAANSGAGGGGGCAQGGNSDGGNGGSGIVIIYWKKD